MVKEKFYKVHLSAITKSSVADILAKSEKALVGRNVKIDLSLLARGKLGELKGKIKEIKDDKAITDPTGLKLYPSYVKRFVRRGVSKVDESFVVETEEKSKIRIKPTLITRKKVSRSVRSELRKESRAYLAKLIASQKLNDVLDEVIKGELQKKLSKKLKKVYPLSFCEIREVKLTRR